jgi:UDP-N-acetylmuramoyl-L-alanyl-D-glutamate--2,6-diaminopimelate ligase
LRAHRPRRLICLFGCGGERDRGKRPLMGAVAEHFADLCILTDDNPRGEDGAAIVAAIRAGMERPEQARVERNRGRAIRYALCLAGPEDIVLVAGKGHETTQKVGDLELPFSDRAQVTQALQEWGGTAP